MIALGTGVIAIALIVIALSSGNDVRGGSGSTLMLVGLPFGVAATVIGALRLYRQRKVSSVHPWWGGLCIVVSGTASTPIGLLFDKVVFITGASRGRSTVLRPGRRLSRSSRPQY